MLFSFTFALFKTGLADANDIRFSPSIKAESVNYFDPVSTQVNQNQWLLREELSGRWKVTKDLKLSFSGRAQQDPSNKSLSERYFADATEFFLEYKINQTQLQLGQIYFNWPGTDGYNPVDVVSPKRYFDPLRSEKLGSPAVSIKSDFEGISIQGLYIPRQTQSQMPGEQSRWLPREIYVPNTPGTKFLLPSTISYSYTGDTYVDRPMENNWGGRISARIESIEAALMYFEGAAPTPALAPTVNGNILSIDPLIVQAASPIFLNTVHYRQQTAGFTLTSPTLGGLVRLAAASTRPTQVQISLPRPATAVVVGFEKTFSLGHHQMTFLPQYSYGRAESSTGNDLASLSHAFDNAFLMGLRYAPSEVWTALITGFFDLQQGAQYFSGELTGSLSDHFKITSTIQIFMAEATTPIGPFRKNGRFILGATWLF